MRTDLYFPRGHSPDECQAAVEAAQTIGLKAFGGQFGYPSVHAVESYRPDRDADTLVCVVTLNQTSAISEQTYVAQRHAYLDELFASLIKVVSNRTVRIETPDGGILHLTWEDTPSLKKSA